MTRFAALFLTALLFSTNPAAAHPHVWVTYDVKPVAGKDGITKINFVWRFDAMFTEMVKEEFGLKKITEKDSGTIRDKAFANLKNYHYYMHIKCDGVDFQPSETSDFKVHMSGKNMVYEFTVTLPKPAKDLELSIWDEEFYVDLDPPTEEIPSDKPPGFMAETKYRTLEFIFPSAEPGAKPPACASKEVTRDNAIWGKILTFTVNCKAAS